MFRNLPINTFDLLKIDLSSNHTSIKYTEICQAYKSSENQLRAMHIFNGIALHKPFQWYFIVVFIQL